jgi:hypothetical protein
MGRVVMSTDSVIFVRYGKAKRAAQLGVTATTFIMLSLWIGPGPALFLIMIAATLVVLDLPPVSASRHRSHGLRRWPDWKPRLVSFPILCPSAPAALNPWVNWRVSRYPSLNLTNLNIKRNQAKVNASPTMTCRASARIDCVSFSAAGTPPRRLFAILRPIVNPSPPP